MFLVILVVCSILAYLLTMYQGRNLLGLGSDHAVHMFIVNKIRKNNHKLFDRVPGIINDAYLGAYPLFMHVVLSYFSDKHIEILTKHYNSTVNGIFVFLGGLTSLLLIEDMQWELMLGICLSLAMCPQFFHVFSARNFGLSSRPVGILLVSILVLLGYFYETSIESSWFVVSGVVVGYLIWGSNTFSQQTIILTGLFEGLIYSSWFLIFVFMLSLAIFITLHNKYALSYIYRTAWFIYTYATQMAKLYILKERHSIWRDFIWDFYKNFDKNDLKISVKYVYRNPIIIIVFLNPFVFFSMLPESFIAADTSFIVYSMRFSFCCFLVFIMTSFRFSRFLGEPERYVEMGTMYSVITSMFILQEISGLLGISIFIFYMSFLYLVQVAIVEKVASNISGQQESINGVQRVIVEKSLSEGDEINFYSNNEDVTKRLMVNDWNFARFWSFETKFAGYNFRDSYTQFPFYKERLTESVLDTYRVNYVVFDKRNPHSRPKNHALSNVETLMDNVDYSVYRLTWNSKPK